MCDKELLVGYLYGELDESERQAFEQHLASCVECRDEIAAFRATRNHLASWEPPAPDLGFEITRSRVVPMRRRFRLSPAWGLAAAAVLVLAVASAVANVEVMMSGDGVVIRTGWQREAAPAAPEVRQAADSAGSSFDEMERRLVRLESALVELGARQDDAPELRAAAADGRPEISDAELLKRVRQFVRESETRQQRELATRIAQVTRELDALHRADLARLQQTIAQSQRLTDTEVLQQREMVNQMYRLVATQR